LPAFLQSRRKDPTRSNYPFLVAIATRHSTPIAAPHPVLGYSVRLPPSLNSLDRQILFIVLFLNLANLFLHIPTPLKSRFSNVDFIPRLNRMRLSQPPSVLRYRPPRMTPQILPPPFVFLFTLVRDKDFLEGFRPPSLCPILFSRGIALLTWPCFSAPGCSPRRSVNSPPPCRRCFPPVFSSSGVWTSPVLTLNHRQAPRPRSHARL